MCRWIMDWGQTIEESRMIGCKHLHSCPHPHATGHDKRVQLNLQDGTTNNKYLRSTE